jgi:alanine-synthesizing transaminase
MRFSKRTDWDTAESELARVYRERLAAGFTIADLTASNPTRCGFEYSADLLDSLSGPAAFEYDPDPKGSIAARTAICTYYSDHGAQVDPSNIVITTSTSESYGYLLKLLCNSGDEILVPQPSYPLFDFLARAEFVHVAAGPFVYDHGWQLELEELRRRIRDKTRAIIMVHPNNPTGHFTKLVEAERLAAICREHNLALIVDEVFLDYALGTPDGSPDPDRCSFTARDLGILVFVVSGISKICGLPQMKMAWLAASGPGSDEAMTRLEVLADTYLSMNAPIQQALPGWLARRGDIQQQIRERVRSNLAELDRVLAAQPTGEVFVNRLKIEGGWYAVLRIPATQPDEVTAQQFLELPDGGVWVHPGYFFGMGASGWLVVSLLCAKAEFTIGIDRLVRHIRNINNCFINH